MADNDTKNAKLKAVIERAKGDRSFREYGNDAGVSSSSIFKIMNGDYRPSYGVIAKLTSKQAKPQGGVTFEEMLAAAGYPVRRDYLLQAHGDSMIMETTVQYGLQSTSEQAASRVEGYASRQYELIAKAAIMDQLVEKGIGFRIQPLENSKEFTTAIENNIRKEWIFVINCAWDIRPSVRYIEQLLGRCLLLTPDESQKVSIVVDNPDYYEELSSYAGKIPFRGDLSIILLDVQEGALKKEFYLSHYDEQDPKEFLIV